MAWRNVQQAISASIPQNLISDPDGFITAFNNAYTPQQKEQAYINYVFPTWNGSDTRNIVAERLLGDNTNYINITADGSTYTIQAYYNGSTISWAQSDFKTSDYTACYVALVDDDTQNSFFSVFIRYRNNQACGQCSGTIPTTSGTVSQQIYTILTSNPYIEYAWQSVPAISGKNGILSLSMIKDEFIGDGSAVNNAPLTNIEQFTEASYIQALNRTLDNGQTVDVIYSGENYKLTYTKNGVGSGYLNFYLMPTTPGAQPSSIYTYHDTVSSGKQYMAFIVDHENEVAAFTFIERKTAEGEPDYVNYLYGGLPDDATMHLLYIWLQGSALPENWTDLNNFEDPPAEGGGDKLLRPNNPIPIPGVPGASAYDSGFMSQWKVTKAQLQSLSRFLWSDNFVDNVKKFFNDPRQIIMGITIFPVLPTVADSSAEIKAGGISTGVNGYKLLYQFERHSMGRCYIPKSLSKGIYWDYEPFTRARVYLPFCGEHELNISDIMGKTLQLDYTVDYVSGMCCAHISIVDEENDLPNNCHYNFTGQMGIQIPVSSEDFGGFYRAMLSAGVGVGGAIATMASGGLTAPLVAAGATANAIGNIANMGKDVQYTSGGGSISGSLASEYPYITIEEPIAFQAPNQQHYMGEPLYDTKQLKDVSGFTKIAAIHLDGLTCTEKEREAIRAQLSKGVIIQQGDELPHPSAPEDEYNFILLQNLSDVDTIGKKFSKTNGVVDYVTISGEVLYNQDFSAVGLLVSEYNSGYNYVYIPAFGRTYYVDSITAESGTMVRYDLVSDAADSFWSELKECEAVIETNEKNYRLMMNNNTWYMQQNKNIKTLTFKINDPENPDDGGAAHFSRAANSTPFILTIAGDDDT